MSDEVDGPELSDEADFLPDYVCEVCRRPGDRESTDSCQKCGRDLCLACRPNHDCGPFDDWEL